MTDYIERRKHIRVYFEQPQVPEGELLIANNWDEDYIPCLIWGLSMGGVRLSIGGMQKFAQRDKLILTNICSYTENRNILPSDSVTLEIGWQIENKKVNRTYLGCRFIALPGSVRDFFSDLVEQRIQQNRVN